ncbi:MAG TPA: hypothetical protein VM553_23390 [Dongiaceae bacterium]|nr:hypothetical protein [Dongiaceae bacterium]
MRLIAFVLSACLIIPGCKNTNEAANNAPLREAQWTLNSEADDFHTPFALLQNNTGDIINAYSSAAHTGGNWEYRVGISRVSPQGEVRDTNLYDDPYHHTLPTDEVVQLSRSPALLSFANGDLLAMSEKGNMFQLTQAGALMHQFQLGELGFDKFKLVAYNAKRACFSGRNETAAALLCLTPSGAVSWQKAVPLEANIERDSAPSLQGAFLGNGDLLDARAETNGVTLTRRNESGDTVWSSRLVLPESIRRIINVIALGDGAAIALNETAEGNVKSHRVLLVDGSGKAKFNETGAGEVRILSYDNNSYLRLVEPDNIAAGYGNSSADLFRHDAAGKALWKQKLALEDIGTEIDYLSDLQISVRQGVINVLQNKQSVRLYSPVVVPVGYFRFIDNVFVSRFGGDGKLLAEDVIGRLNYLVDYEGFIFKFNQYGFYPKVMLDTGTQYVLSGLSYVKGSNEGPDAVPTLASYALSR